MLWHVFKDVFYRMIISLVNVLSTSAFCMEIEIETSQAKNNKNPKNLKTHQETPIFQDF